MILNEETFDILNFDVPDVTNADIEVADIDATVPEAGPEVGVETLLMQAIKDIYGMIEGYNSLSIALTDIGNESAAVAIADIIRMEHSNIGALQDILKEISPNAEAVDINESLNEDTQKIEIVYKEIGTQDSFQWFKEELRNFDLVLKTWYRPHGSGSTGMCTLSGTPQNLIDFADSEANDIDYIINQINDPSFRKSELSNYYNKYNTRERRQRIKVPKSSPDGTFILFDPVYNYIVTEGQVKARQGKTPVEKVDRYNTRQEAEQALEALKEKCFQKYVHRYKERVRGDKSLQNLSDEELFREMSGYSKDDIYKSIQIIEVPNIDIFTTWGEVYKNIMKK